MSHMLSGLRYFRMLGSLIVGVAFVAAPSTARADAFAAYQITGSFTVPSGSGPYDVLADGRVIALDGDTVYLETALRSRMFALHGTLAGADIPGFGAAFIRVSPDGTKIAVGNNGGTTTGFKVGVVDFNTLGGVWFDANHFLAEWIDNTNLAIAASDFFNGSSVTVLDTTSVDAANPTNTTIVANVGGASGGIAFDLDGNLFVGNGFSSIGPSGTGTIKAFTQAAWLAALLGGSPLDFENEGMLIVQVLGASPLRFDVEGNLLAGGGSAAPENDAVALVRASAIADALAGMGAIDETDPTLVRRFDPIPSNDFNFYSVVYNGVAREFYTRDFGSTQLHVYRDVTGIPTVSQWGLVSMSLLMMTVGTLVARRHMDGSAPVR